MEAVKPTYEQLLEENTVFKAKITDQSLKITDQSLEITEQGLKITELKAQIAELRRLMYGTKSESRGSNRTPPKKKRKK